MATAAQLTAISTELHRLHDEHKAEDAEAFRNLNHGVGAIKENMAKASDLDRLEDKLDQLLLDGFKHGRAT